MPFAMAIVAGFAAAGAGVPGGVVPGGFLGLAAGLTPDRSVPALGNEGECHVCVGVRGSGERAGHLLPVKGLLAFCEDEVLAALPARDGPATGGLQDTCHSITLCTGVLRTFVSPAPPVHRSGARGRGDHGRLCRIIFERLAKTHCKMEARFAAPWSEDLTSANPPPYMYQNIAHRVYNKKNKQ